MTYIPDFPRDVGEEAAVEFHKDGHQYRILRVDDANVLIHRRGLDAAEFELLLTNFSADGSMFDVFGRGEVASVTGLGANRTILGKLF
jgi:hypothetical protein